MDSFGQMILIFTALVATSQCLPEDSKPLPDASVFEITPPKEFLELFKPDDSKKLNNPMKSPLAAALRIQNMAELSKLLPDPSVFEMTPPQEFLDLFRKKEKENDVIQKEVSLTPNKETSEVTSKPETSDEHKEPTQIVMTTTEKVDKISEEPQPLRNWPFEMNDFGGNMKFPDWFYLPDLKPEENTNIVKQSEAVEIQPQTTEWNRETFESHSFYYPPQLNGNKNWKPFNMFAPDEGLTGFQHIFSQQGDDNDIKVRDDSKKHNKDIVRPDITIKDALNQDVKISTPSQKNISAPLSTGKINDDIKIVKANKNVEAETSTSKEILPSKDIEEAKPVKVMHTENKPSPPKAPVLNKPILVPVTVVTDPQTQQYGYGSLVYMSSSDPPQNNIYKVPNLAYGYWHSEQPSLHLSRLEVKPEVVHGINKDKKSTQNINKIATDVAAMIPSKPVLQIRSIGPENDTMVVIKNDDNIDDVSQILKNLPDPNALNMPNNAEPNQANSVPNPQPEINQGYIAQPYNPSYGNNYPQNMQPGTMNQGVLMYPSNPGQPLYAFNPNNVGPNNFPQNQRPIYVNTPYGTNGVPNYIFANGPQTNGQGYQNYPNSGLGVMVPSQGGYNPNMYALVPVSNGYNQNPSVSNAPNGYQPTGPVYFIAGPNNMSNTKDESE